MRLGTDGDDEIKLAILYTPVYTGLLQFFPFLGLHDAGQIQGVLYPLPYTGQQVARAGHMQNNPTTCDVVADSDPNTKSFCVDRVTTTPP